MVLEAPQEHFYYYVKPQKNAVRVKHKKTFTKPVSLSSIKKHPYLKELSLVKQSRLSVMPIDTKSWKIINKISNIRK